jgi:hypothetical protein
LRFSQEKDDEDEDDESVLGLLVLFLLVHGHPLETNFRLLLSVMVAL